MGQNKYLKASEHFYTGLMLTNKLQIIITLMLGMLMAYQEE